MTVGVLQTVWVILERFVQFALTLNMTTVATVVVGMIVTIVTVVMVVTIVMVVMVVMVVTIVVVVMVEMIVVVDLDLAPALLQELLAVTGTCAETSR